MFADRVKDTTTSTGTGNVTLSGTAPTGFVSFNTAFGTGTTFYYCIEDGTNWEVGIGTLSASTTLVRSTILASSNAGSAVNFGAGEKTVFSTIPAAYLNGVSVATKTTNYTATSDDDVILVDCTSGAVTITLHPAATAKQKVYNFKKIDASANAMTIDGNSTETIDGAANVSTTVRYTNYTLVPNNATGAWLIL